MTLSKRETDLFDSIRDIDVENFMLIEFNGRPIIVADMSDEQDGSQVQPLYGRLSDAEAEKIVAALNEEPDDDERPRRQAKQPKRWGG